MGRVRTTFIKRAARELLQRYPERFGADFEQNKKVVDEFLPHLGKPIRNRIAGYISTLIQQQEGGD